MTLNSRSIDYKHQSASPGRAFTGEDRVMGRCKAASVRSAFTLVELMVALPMAAILFIGLYLGFSQGFAVIQLARENLRATQILQEKTELIRLFHWDALSAAPNPYAFTNWYYPTAKGDKQGIAYIGTRIISDPPVSENYSNEMKLVTFQLTWTSGKVKRQREMSTLVSQYGLHNYVLENR